MTLRIFLLLLAVLSPPARAQDEDAATLERMGYTREWLRANGYSSYREYRGHQRQQEAQRRRQELEQQQSQRALEVEHARLQAAEAQWEAAIALEQAVMSSRYFSLLPRSIFVGPTLHSPMGGAVDSEMHGFMDRRSGVFSLDIGNDHADRRKGATRLAP